MAMILAKISRAWACTASEGAATAIAVAVAAAPALAALRLVPSATADSNTFKLRIFMVFISPPIRFLSNSCENNRTT